MIKLERNKNTYSLLFNKLEDIKFKNLYIRSLYMFMLTFELFLVITTNPKLYFITGIFLSIIIENKYIYYIPIQLMKKRTKRVAP